MVSAVSKITARAKAGIRPGRLLVSVKNRLQANQGIAKNLARMRLPRACGFSRAVPPMAALIKNAAPNVT